MREKDASAVALVDIGHSPAFDFQELLCSEWLCAIGHWFFPLEHSESVRCHAVVTGHSARACRSRGQPFGLNNTLPPLSFVIASPTWSKRKVAATGVEIMPPATAGLPYASIRIPFVAPPSTGEVTESPRRSVARACDRPWRPLPSRSHSRTARTARTACRTPRRSSSLRPHRPAAAPGRTG